MKAWAINSYGDNSVMRMIDRPVPAPAPGEVLIRVASAGLNPIDFKTRSGKLQRMLAYSMPLVLGNECAGVVTAAGSGVRRFKAGDEVYMRAMKNRIGTLAEYIAADENCVAHKPKNISFDEAAGLPLVGLTVYQAFTEFFGLKRGDRVFIPAGAGGIGTFAIQLARHIGAQVITNCSGKNVEFVKSLGAAQVVDYTREDFSKVVAPVDFAFDTMGGQTLEKSFRIIKRGGKIISISGPPTAATMRRFGLPLKLQLAAGLMGLSSVLKAAARGASYDYMFMRPDGAQLDMIRDLVEKGVIKPVVGAVYPFEKANEAMAFLESGRARGKIIVHVGRD